MESALIKITLNTRVFRAKGNQVWLRIAVSEDYPKGTPTHQSVVLLFKDKGKDCTKPIDLVGNTRLALGQGSKWF